MNAKTNKQTNKKTKTKNKQKHSEGSFKTWEIRSAIFRQIILVQITPTN